MLTRTLITKSKVILSESEEKNIHTSGTKFLPGWDPKKEFYGKIWEEWSS